MSKLGKQRGSAYEREVCHAIEEQLGIPTRRKLGQARDSGNDIDIPKAHGGRFRLECKRRRSLATVYGWMAQATNSCDPGDVPAVVFRADGEKSLVVLTLEDFLALVGNEL